MEHLVRRDAQTVAWPEWVTPPVVAAFLSSGVDSLWSHQERAASLAHDGRHVVMATGTASGKSLGYLVPVLSDLHDGLAAATGRGATALYLSPTKALAADQRARIEALAIPGIRVATYDGDTPSDERRWIRDHAHLVLTNPDLLHHSLLPGHQHWAPFLRSLRYVVVDECHVYRGVFGSHVSAVLRRLRRVAARYRSDPTFVLASATVSDPAVHASQLIGMPCEAVTEDGSPREAMTFALWEPPMLPDGGSGLRASAQGPSGAGQAGAAQPRTGPSGAAQSRGGPSGAGRRSATTEAAELLAELVADGVQTVAFARSRAGVEALAAATRRRLGLP